MSNYEKCPICKQWGWSNTHRCGDYFRVEYEGNIDTECSIADQLCDVKRTYANNFEDAANKFVEQYQAQSAWYPSEMTVYVMNKEETKILKIIVRMEMVPYYFVDELSDAEEIEIKHDEETKE